MDKLRMHSPDLTERNIDLLAELFPTVVTEGRDEEGKAVRAIDFDVLRQELSDRVIEGPQERYQLDWPGKREAAFAANAPIAKTLRPVREESVNFDTTKNLFIEGDNLDALKLLQESYLGKVKLIYIDPPYNTGNDFVYSDDFAESNAEYLARSRQVDDAGNRLVANTESNGRFHSDWLSMIYARLRLARNLLADDGVVCVSIDGTEIAQLKLLLAEIFGERNFVATIVWVSNLKGRQIADGGPVGTHEYILCFARNSEAIEQFRGAASEFKRLMPTIYKGDAYAVKHDAKGPYVTKNELYNTNSKFNERTAPTMVFRIHYNPQSGEARVTDIGDQATFPGFLSAMPHANSRPGLNWHAWRWSRAKILADSQDLEFDVSVGDLRIRTKIRDVDGMTMKDIIVGPSTVTGQADLDALGLQRLFDTPKPVSLLQTLVSVATSSDDLVMDFFAGSSSTAHAVMGANAVDGGSRRFIMVQLDEVVERTTEAARAGYCTIADLSKERIRRAGSKVSNSGGLAVQNLDVGFRVLKVDSTNLTDVLRTPDALAQAELKLYTGSVKADRTGEDLLFQVMLEWGLELTIPIVVETIEGHEVFVVEDGALIASFDDEVSVAAVREIAKRGPLRAVFRDSGFATDAERINVEQIIAEVSPATDVKAV